MGIFQTTGKSEHILHVSNNNQHLKMQSSNTTYSRSRTLSNGSKISCRSQSSLREWDSKLGVQMRAVMYALGQVQLSVGCGNATASRATLAMRPLVNYLQNVEGEWKAESNRLLMRFMSGKLNQFSKAL